MQLAFFMDHSRCTGCHTCTVACKDWHDIPAGPVNWRRTIKIEKGKLPHVYVAFYTISCLHCAKPACISACPANAIYKRKEDGIVMVDQELCLGKDCGLCLQACPYDAPQFGEEEDARMQKCDFCAERWAEGRKPICVEACPMRALDAGPIEEMREKYGTLAEVEGFTYDQEIRPSIILKPRAPELLETPE